MNELEILLVDEFIFVLDVDVRDVFMILFIELCEVYNIIFIFVSYDVVLSDYLIFCVFVEDLFVFVEISLC